MVGVKGVTGIPEPSPERSTNVRDRKRTGESGAPAKDGVRISPEAKEAADTARLVQLANEEPDIRAEKVDAAREALERGDYKIPSVIAEVAKRLSQYIP